MLRPQDSTLHATSVSYDGRGLLILGASGSGKSSLALELMALGCDLIADDRTNVAVQDGQIMASCPAAISGQIEARGFGILTASPAPPTPLVCAINLDHSETARLPEPRSLQLMGQSLRLFHKTETSAFPAAIMQYLKSIAPCAPQ